MAELSEDQKRRLEAPQFFYSVGWSHGKEKFEGKPDYLKGSYYANPIYESWQGHANGTRPRDTVKNIWPDSSLPDFRSGFKELGGLINNVGI